MQKGARILVTGGAGFIGSHTVDRLLHEGMQVTVLDDLSQGNVQNIKKHENRKNFSFVQGDIRDLHVVKKSLKDADAVIHLAALTSIKQSFENPHLYNSINVDGTLNLLESSLNSKVNLFIYASSAAVYGTPKKVPIKENHPLRPLSPYGITKMTSESYVRVFYEVFGLRTICFRYFNVYGPGQKRDQYAGVITKFLDSVKNNRPLTIFGDGKQTRDFVNIKDVVKAHLLALKQEVGGETYNIGTGTATTIEKLARTLVLTTDNIRIKTFHTVPQKGDIGKSIADISKAKKDLNFFPEVTLKEGLRELVTAM